MDLKEAIALRKREEELLCFPKFSNEDALELGLKIVELAKAKGVSVVVGIEVNDVPLFYHAMKGTNKRQFRWVKRKLGTVRLCQVSTIHAGYQLAADGKELWRDWRLTDEECATIGGGFPINVSGTGIIGAVACSGLPHEEDHKLLVEAISSVLGVEL